MFATNYYKKSYNLARLYFLDGKTTLFNFISSLKNVYLKDIL